MELSPSLLRSPWTPILNLFAKFVIADGYSMIVSDLSGVYGQSLSMEGFMEELEVGVG